MTMFLFFIRRRDIFTNTVCRDGMDNETGTTRFLEPHREVSIPCGAR
jgi:hypothetical protein